MKVTEEKGGMKSLSLKSWMFPLGMKLYSLDITFLRTFSIQIYAEFRIRKTFFEIYNDKFVTKKK